MRLPTMLAVLSLAACGQDDGPKADYSKCSVPSRIILDDWDLLTPCLAPDGGSCDPPSLSVALAKGAETEVPLVVKDSEGDLCDPSALTATAGDPGLIEVISLGEKTVLKATRDAFDNGGAEPSTRLRFALGDLAVEWPAFGVIDLEGSWAVTVYHAEMYPEGLLIGEFVFTQRGRHLKWQDCSVEEACDEAGTVKGDRLTLMTRDANFMLDGTIDPNRVYLSGTWSTTHYEGTWKADRADE